METPVLESLLNKVLATLLKRGSNTGGSYEICEIFKSTYFEEHLQMTASICKWFAKILVSQMHA